jgi:hypothetical protein
MAGSAFLPTFVTVAVFTVLPTFVRVAVFTKVPTFVTVAVFTELPTFVTVTVFTGTDAGRPDTCFFVRACRSRPDHKTQRRAQQ